MSAAELGNPLLETAKTIDDFVQSLGWQSVRELRVKRAPQATGGATDRTHPRNRNGDGHPVPVSSDAQPDTVPAKPPRERAVIKSVAPQAHVCILHGDIWVVNDRTAVRVGTMIGVLTATGSVSVAPARKSGGENGSHRFSCRTTRDTAASQPTGTTVAVVNPAPSPTVYITGRNSRSIQSTG